MITGSIFLFLNLLILLFTVDRNIKQFVFFTILSLSSGTFILFKLNYPFAPTYANFIYAVILFGFLISLFRLRQSKITLVFLSYIFLFLLYIFISKVVKQLDTNQFSIVRHYFWGVMLFLLIVNSKERIDIKWFDNFILKFVLFYAILGILQFLFSEIIDFFRIAQYEWGGKTKYIFTSTDFIYNNIIIGTFFRMANFGNLMGVLIIYLYSKFLLNPSFFNRNLVLITLFISILAVLLTGIRTSALTMIIGLIAISFFYSKTVFRYILFTTPLLIIYNIGLLMSIGTNSVLNSSSIANPFTRLAGVFFLISSEGDYRRMTITRTVNIFNEFIKNPLFGTGAYEKLFTMGISSLTDAYLLFLLIQFGIIGIILLLMPVLYYLKIVKQQNRKFYRVILVVFIVLLLQTITDNGFYYLLANAFFWVIAAVNYFPNNFKGDNILT